jgi:hypothetical protein
MPWLFASPNIPFGLDPIFDIVDHAPRSGLRNLVRAFGYAQLQAQQFVLPQGESR